MKKFPPSEKSTFAYWFAHWCAFNMVALDLGVWKFRHLFHDWEKPWLKLFLPYEKVQHIHRYHSSHHGEFFLKHGWLHWDDLVIDWECSRFTKEQSPWPAKEVIYKEIDKLHELGASDEQVSVFTKHACDKIIELGLN